MSDAPVVFVPAGKSGEWFLAHRGLVEAAGGVVEPVDLDDAAARRAALARATAGAMGLLPFGEADFAAARNLRAIVVAATGVDPIDLDAATRHGVMIGNTPDLCIEEVADHTLLLLLACYRRLPRILAQRQAGQPVWPSVRRDGGAWPRLRGQTVGLLGFGNIPRAVAGRCRAFGLQVIAHDPYIDARLAHDAGVELVAFEELLARADFLSVHTPLTPSTRHIVNADTLALMKPTAFLLNTARGPLVDEAALVQALRAGSIAGAGLDVFEVEPPAPDNPLLALPNVIATPHTAGFSDGAAAWGPESAMRDAAVVVRGGRPRSIQNPDVLSRLRASGSE